MHVFLVVQRVTKKKLGAVRYSIWASNKIKFNIKIYIVEAKLAKNGV